MCGTFIGMLDFDGHVLIVNTDSIMCVSAMDDGWYCHFNDGMVKEISEQTFEEMFNLLVYKDKSLIHNEDPAVVWSRSC
jgi:hypothetical protein